MPGPAADEDEAQLVKVAVVSQKGGVGKSTVARLIAREYAQNGWRVMIADMDRRQLTSHNWSQRRAANEVTPDIPTEPFATVSEALAAADGVDLLIFDGPPHASTATRKMAHEANLVLLPTGLSTDDLEPQVKLAHELHADGIPLDRIAFVLWRVGDSEIEIQQARDYIEAAGYRTLSRAVPERISYRRASDAGRTATETRYGKLNNRADEAAQSVVDAITANH